MTTTKTKVKILILRTDEELHRTAFLEARARGMSVSSLIRHLILFEAKKREAQKQNSAGVVSQAAPTEFSSHLSLSQ